MNRFDRYDISSLPESQFEPGSNNQVLRNKLGITSVSEMDKREKEEQLQAMDELTDLFDSDHRFAATDGQAIQIGLGGNYMPMEKVFAAVIRKTLRAREPR